MTAEEKQEIINAVLSSLQTNAKTIDQLPPDEGWKPESCFELGTGTKMSLGHLKNEINKEQDPKINTIESEYTSSVFTSDTTEYKDQF